MAAGHLPHLGRLRDRGAYGNINGLRQYKAETPWNTFLTGVLPQKNGYWGEIKLRPQSYEIEDIQAYDFEEYPPFYALGDRHRVAVFDLPKARLDEQLQGQQMLAWGAHSPSTPRKSLPAGLFAQVETQFGPHPTFEKDHGDWWDKPYLQRLYQGLQEGIRRRSKVCQDWLQQESWDLFLTVFSETHSAGHDFCFLSDPAHPLYSERSRFAQNLPQGFAPGDDPLLEIYKSTDRAIGEIVETAPQNANIVVFSLHGSGPNNTDVPAMFFLAEFLYRFSFPEEPGRIAVGDIHQPALRPCLHPRRKTWTGEIWSRRYDPKPLRGLLRRLLPTFMDPYINQILGQIHPQDLASPETLRLADHPFFWQPASWYQPLWPEMRAFALPSFSEGYVRINLKGREPQGRVEPEDYESTCDEIIAALQALRNPRTGDPVVKDVMRTRDRANAADPRLPDADLIVEWCDPPVDVIDSPEYGRIGPVPFRRTGSHRPRGFLIAQGPDIEPGSSLKTGEPVDVPATLLTLMGLSVPPSLEGKTMIQPKAQPGLHSAQVSEAAPQT